MVFTLFQPETQPWIDNEPITRSFAVQGAFAPVSCTDEGLCVTTTGMGKANAALSVSAVLNSPDLDLFRALFLSAGIAGTPPEVGTLGDAAWADWVVDFDLGHHTLPESPTTNPAPDDLFVNMSSAAGTEVFRLNPDLVSLAFDTTRDLELPDSDKARAYRALYPHQENQVPNVMRCDTLTGDNYWHGEALSRVASALTSARTGGQGTYCATQMEDNSIAAALFRAGYLDRYTALRTMSNFDRPPPGQTVKESMAASSGGFPLSIASEYKVGSTYAHYVLANHEAVLALTGGNLTVSDFTVTVGGQSLTGSVLLDRSRTLVRADELAAALGATSSWNQATQSVSIATDGKLLTFPTVTGTATVDGVEYAGRPGPASMRSCSMYRFASWRSSWASPSCGMHKPAPSACSKETREQGLAQQRASPCAMMPHRGEHQMIKPCCCIPTGDRVRIKHTSKGALSCDFCHPFTETACQATEVRHLCHLPGCA